MVHHTKINNQLSTLQVVACPKIQELEK